MRRKALYWWLVVLAVVLVAGCGDDRAGGSDGAPGMAEPTAEPSGIELRLDKLLYRDGQSLSVELHFKTLTPSDEAFDVVLATPEGEDVEVVTLRRVEPGRYASQNSTPIRELAGDSDHLDDVLTVESGAMFFAFYFPDKSEPLLSRIEASVITDFGLFEEDSASHAPVTIQPELAMTDDERNPPFGAKPVGTILPEGGLPVQLATHELIFYPTDDVQLQRFLEESGGEIIAQQESVGDDEDAEPVTAYLIRIDPDQPLVEWLPRLRGLFGEEGELLASKEEALAIYTLALYYRLEGYMVAVNPRAQLQGAPALTSTEQNNVTHTMRMVPAKAPTNVQNCMPGDPTLPCVENVPAVWSFLALTDRDAARVEVAVLDDGFAINDDFRRPENGDMVECVVSATAEIECRPGAAEGSPTVGSSLFGPRVWHGNGVVATLGGVVNNDYGTAGVGGQVVVPMLYNYNLWSYAFELGAGIRRATLDGAACINISAGYPCEILTNIGPDFQVCSRGGRAAVCAEVLGATASVLPAVCGIFPPACPFVSKVAIVETAACIGLVSLFDDLRGPIESGVRAAFNAGVPVVTIAGNAMNASTLPAGIRDFVSLSDQRVERWGIMPAMAPEAIVVGAVDVNLDNAHFFGERVDIWAPTGTAYMAPEDVDDINSPPELQNYHPTKDTKPLGGTSAAAPFIAGVIAAMQAVNPSLNRNTPGLGIDPARRNIVPRIKAILRDDANSFSNAELKAMGYSDQPKERRRLVNPLLAVQAAARAEPPKLTDRVTVLLGFPDLPRPIPDLIALGYDQALGFREAQSGKTDDSSLTARPISFGDTVMGTVVNLRPPGSPPDKTKYPDDDDWFSFPMIGEPGRVLSVEVKLRYPHAFGSPTVFGDSIQVGPGPKLVTDDESETVLRAVAPSGSSPRFGVVGDVQNDNIYRVTLGHPEVIAPTLEITEPTASSELFVCAFEPTTFRVTAAYDEAPNLSVPPVHLNWLVNGQGVDTGNQSTRAFAEGQYDVEVRAFGDAAISDGVAVIARNCTNAPTAHILTPSADAVVDDDGFDMVRGLSFADVTLQGEALDPEDGDLSGSALLWTTNRTDYQGEVLGTGTSLTVRLYLDDICAGQTHIVTLQATDSDGNPSVPVQRRITIRRLIC